MSRPALAVLRALWQWREAEAVAANKPPYFILAHEKLVGIAEAATYRQVDTLVPRHLSDRRRADLLRAVKTGLGLPIDQHPEHLRSVNRRPTEVERRRFAELAARRDERAAALDIDPTLIASRTTISELASDWNKCAPELMSWQRELLGA